VKRRLVPMILVGLTVAAPGAAQEAKKLEPVVVTATKIETPAEEIGASVSVVGAPMSLILTTKESVFPL